MSEQQQQQVQTVPSIAALLNCQQMQRSEEQNQQHSQPTIKIQMTTKNAQKSNSLSKRMQSKRMLLNSSCIIFGEMIATALLMFLGCMGCVESSLFVNSHLQCSINFGFVVLICIQCFGCVSGAHLNPAVTLANLIYGEISVIMAILYFVAQMLGSFIGYGLLKASLPNSAVCSSETPEGVCVTSVASGLAVWQGFLIEFLLTCVLITICCAVWDPRNAKFQDSTAIRFGLSIACLSLTGGQFTGASMNPVRSFGPAVWNNVWDDHWIYWAGPLLAAVVTSVIYKYVFRRSAEASEDATN